MYPLFKIDDPLDKTIHRGVWSQENVSHFICSQNIITSIGDYDML